MRLSTVSSHKVRIPNLLDTLASEKSISCALKMGDMELSVGEWNVRAGRFAAGLASDYGVERGEFVGLVFDDLSWLSFAIAYVGVQRLGAVPVVVAPRCTPDAMSRALQSLGCAVVVQEEDFEPFMFPGWELPRQDAGYRVVDPAAIERSGDGHETGELHPSWTKGDLAEVGFTSGTTGVPKAIYRTHESLTERARRRATARSGKGFAYLYANGYVNAGSGSVLAALTYGVTVINLAPFLPYKFASIVEEDNVVSAMMYPWMLRWLVNSGALELFGLSSLRSISTTSCRLPRHVARSLHKSHPHILLSNPYTLAEIGGAVTAGGFDLREPTCVGTPMGDVDVRISDGHGGAAGHGELGEIYVRSLRQGHTAAPEDGFDGTEEADAWIRTGDIGKLDHLGRLHVIERAHRSIEYGSRSIAASDVEEVILQNPRVTDAHVMAVTHPTKGETFAAALVANDELDEAALWTEVGSVLDIDLRTGVTLYVPSIPRLPSGKVEHIRLRKALMRALGV